MSNNIAVITQEDFQPKLLPNSNPTMVIPSHLWLLYWFPSSFLLKKKLVQMTLCGRDDTPAPEPNFIQIPSHNGGSPKVQAYKYYTTPATSHGNKKRAKTIKSKKKTG
jgi:hypothetical protein